VRSMLTVFRKELSDDFTSLRFLILFGLVLLAGIFSVYIAANTISSNTTTEVSSFATNSASQFIFLQLFTISSESLSASFLTFITLFVPIVGIALGFDAINSERNAGTLSRLLSQPVYRDDVINGKFLAGVSTIAIMLISIVLLVAGIGLRIIGVPPSAEEVIRLIAFLGLGIVYGAFWLSISMLFSVLVRRIATSALASIAIWIFFYFFISIIASSIAGRIAPISDSSTTTEQLKYLAVNVDIMRISPVYLFQEASSVILSPDSRTLSELIQIQAQGLQAWMMPSPLSVAQSIIMVWPQIVTLIALTVISFAISYVKFMREEIRST